MTEKPKSTYVHIISSVLLLDKRITNKAMIQSIDNPHPELSLREERVPLTEGIKLRVAVQDAGRDELIKHSNDDWR